MYSLYAFWRQKSSDLPSGKTEPVVDYKKSPIVINNTQNIVIKEENIQYFLDEGKRAEMEKLVKSRGLSARLKRERGESKSVACESNSVSESGTTVDGDEPYSPSSVIRRDTMESGDEISYTSDEECEISLEEAKSILQNYSKILMAFSKFKDKVGTIVQHINILGNKFGSELEDTIIELNILEYVKQILISYLPEEESDSFSPYESSMYTIVLILGILSDFTDSSVKYCKNVLEIGMLQYFKDVLKNPVYRKNLDEWIVAELYEGALSPIHNCIRIIPDDPIYEKENIKETVKDFLSSDKDVLRVLSIMIISALISEDENQKMEHAGSIPYIVESFNKTFESDDGRFDGFSKLEFLECLVRIAANDVNKIKVIEAGILPSLVKTLKSSDDEEVLISAKLIWLLCFDEDAKQKVIEEVGCTDVLKTLLQSKNSKIRHMVSGALWKIKGEQQYHERQDQIMDKPTISNEQKHIFISYQWGHQETILKIKDKLKKDGHKVWIDVEQMGGSTLESMAHAVENARVVLVCASEKYKISPNCRTEAEYTFQLKKPILPLMLQRYYKPDGWLGMLLGAKMYVNFDGKYEFSYAYQMLQKELLKFTDISKTEPTVDVSDGAAMVQSSFVRPPSTPVTTQWERKAAKWDNKQVIEWAKTNNLTGKSNKLQGLFEEMDGELMVHFIKLKKEAPEFFYGQLQKEYNLDLLAIMKLNKAFDVILKKA